MSNAFYNFSPRFIPGTKVRAQAVNTQFDLLEDAFDLLPAVPGSINLGTSTLGVESGSGNAYVVAMPTTRAANADGDEVVFKATHQNSGAATLQVDAIAAVPLVRFNGDALSSGDILSGVYYEARYDATNIRFIIIAPAQSTVVGTISYANPSASVGLTAVNGVATTVMRSDSAPALSQSITPTWSGQHTFSQPILGAAGTNLLPSYSFSGDPNTGLYSAGADRIGFAAAGAAIGEIAASGNLLWQNGIASLPAYSFISDPDTGAYSGGANVWAVATGGVLRFSVDGSGNGIFTGAVSGSNLSSSGGANPSASVGLTAVNGSAITFMRSDGAPALSQSITPTWSAQHTFSSPILGANSTNGTAATPAYAFSGDPNTGAYNVSADVWGVSAGGTLRFSVNASGNGVFTGAVSGTNLSASGGANPSASVGLAAVNGTAITFMRSDGAPALSQSIAPTWTGSHTFSNTTAQAVFNNSGAGTDAKNAIIRVNGTGTFVVSSSTDAAPTTAVSNVIIGTRTGAAWTNLTFGNATDNPTFTFAGSGAVTATGQFQGPAGSAGTPTYSFSGDTNTGMYSGGADIIAFQSGGTLVGQVAASGNILWQNGIVSLPAFSFSGDPNTGMYTASADTISFATGGVNRLDIGVVAVSSAIPFYAPNGSAAAPSYAFNSDTNSGLFWNSADDVRIVAGGIAGVIVTGNGSLTNVEFGSSSSSAMTLNCITAATANTGAAGAPPAQVAGYLSVIINGTARKIPYYVI